MNGAETGAFLPAMTLRDVTIEGSALCCAWLDPIVAKRVRPILTKRRTVEAASAPRWARRPETYGRRVDGEVSCLYRDDFEIRRSAN